MIFSQPCVCDIKMGRTTTDEEAHIVKKTYMGAIDSLSTSSQLGFRVCGMRVRELWHSAYYQDLPNLF